MGLKRTFGKIIYNGLAKHMPLSDSRINFGAKKLRSLCGKLILKYCGKSVNIEKGASFHWNISLGDDSGIGVNALISSEVTIGKHVMMGPECKIFTQNHAFDRTDIPMQQQGFSEVRPVSIGDDVWIGANVIILPGVQIGSGAIIGAGSVVTKNVDAFSIVGGNPARLIRVRKDEKSK